MTAPLTDERLAEIRERDAFYDDVRDAVGPNSAEHHRGELLADRDRLAGFLARMQERTEVAEAARDGLEAALKVERGRTTSAEKLLVKAMDELGGLSGRNKALVAASQAQGMALEQAFAERDQLHDALSDVLAGDWDEGLSGFRRTYWITAERVQGWRDVLASTQRSGSDADTQPEPTP